MPQDGEPTLDEVPGAISESGAFADVPGVSDARNNKHIPAAQSLSEYVEHMPAYATGGQDSGTVMWV